MDANEFWCRAFLVAMGDYVDDPGACEDAANAALAVAQRRGMVAAPPESQTTGQMGFDWEQDGDFMIVRATSVPENVRVALGTESVVLRDGRTMVIKWGESAPPKPIEVWIERKAGA